MTFDSLIAAKTNGFVGRDYVFSDIERFVKSQREGYFVLEGAPGSGKTAIIAEYVRRTGCIAHFNSAVEGITAAAQFVENVCSQIALRFNFAESIPPSAPDETVRLSSQLVAASRAMVPQQTLVIAVDAIDEVDPSSYPPGANLLCLPPTLPKGIFFILSCRSGGDTRLRVIDTPLQKLNLDSLASESYKDIQAYVSKAADDSSMKAWLKSQDLTVDEFVQAISSHSEGNFLYVRSVLEHLVAGAYRDELVSRIPLTLEAYYEHLLQQTRTEDVPRWRDKLHVLFVLSAARSPVSLQLLTTLLPEVNANRIRDILDELKRFLSIDYSSGTARYSLFHRTFSDFIQRRDIVQAAAPTPEQINADIADTLLRRLLGKS
jgi:hypothetical protein